MSTLVTGGAGFIEPEIAHRYRAGDIRHYRADPSLAREVLGFEAKVAFGDGPAALVRSLADQEAEDRVEAAARELVARGLAR